MATPLVLNDVVVAVLVQTYPGQIALTVRYWQVSVKTGVGAVTYDDAAKKLDDDFSQPYKDVMCNTAGWYGVQLRVSRPTNNSGWAYSKANVGAGTAGATPMSTQTTGLIHLSTDWFGKTGAGRIYLPFPSVSDTSADGTPTAGYATRAQAIQDLFESGTTVIGLDGVSTVFLKAVVFNPVTNNPLAITTTRLADAWATQKRRGSFGRLNHLPW
jgi:hypothetical protein